MQPISPPIDGDVCGDTYVFIGFGVGEPNRQDRAALVAGSRRTRDWGLRMNNGTSTEYADCHSFDTRGLPSSGIMEDALGPLLSACNSAPVADGAKIPNGLGRWKNI